MYIITSNLQFVICFRRALRLQSSHKLSIGSIHISYFLHNGIVIIHVPVQTSHNIWGYGAPLKLFNILLDVHVYQHLAHCWITHKNKPNRIKQNKCTFSERKTISLPGLVPLSNFLDNVTTFRCHFSHFRRPIMIHNVLSCGFSWYDFGHRNTVRGKIDCQSWNWLEAFWLTIYVTYIYTQSFHIRISMLNNY